MVFQVSRDVMPKDYTPSVGDTLQMRTKQGMPMNVTVASVEEDKVLLDANHSLAGKELTFKVTLGRSPGLRDRFEPALSGLFSYPFPGVYFRVIQKERV